MVISLNSTGVSIYALHTLKDTFMKFILASGSPYRAAQLKQLHLEFIAKSPDIDESLVKALTISVNEKCLELARLKAEKVAKNYPNDLVIAGDQMGLHNNIILDKPGNKKRAFAQLKTLQGSTHQLLSSLCVHYKGKHHLHLQTNTLKMRTLTDKELEYYIDKDKPTDCAGSYKIESLGFGLFESIETSDFSSIMGLPLLKLVDILKQLEISIYN